MPWTFVIHMLSAVLPLCFCCNWYQQFDVKIQFAVVTSTVDVALCPHDESSQGLMAQYIAVRL